MEENTIAISGLQCDLNCQYCHIHSFWTKTATNISQLLVNNIAKLNLHAYANNVIFHHEHFFEPTFSNSS